MIKTYIIKIIILVGLVGTLFKLMHIENIKIEKQKEINSQELYKIDGKILIIQIINHNQIETDAKIFVKKNHTLLHILDEFYDIKVNSDNHIKSIKDIPSDWEVFVNGQVVDINTYIPSDGDLIVISDSIIEDYQ